MDLGSATVVVADLNEQAGKETVEELKRISGSNRYVCLFSSINHVAD
jgi:hypothetical protein